MAVFTHTHTHTHTHPHTNTHTHKHTHTQHTHWDTVGALSKLWQQHQDLKIMIKIKSVKFFPVYLFINVIRPIRHSLTHSDTMHKHTIWVTQTDNSGTIKIKKPRLRINPKSQLSKVPPSFHRHVWRRLKTKGGWRQFSLGIIRLSRQRLV